MNWNQDQYNPYVSNQGDPYSNSQQQQPRSSLTWLWVLLGGGIVAVLACCGVCGGLSYIVMQEDDQEIRAMFEDDPVVLEQIGNVQSVHRDWGKSMDEEDQDIWYFRIEGDKADGHIVIKERDYDVLDIEWARLELDTGERFELQP